MKSIELTRGYKTLVDDEDYDELNRYLWHAHDSGKTYIYACRLDHKSGMMIYMHRYIMRAPPHLTVDHRDKNTLNNTRSNLRLADKRQQSANSKKYTGCYSKYKGVSKMTRSPKWWAYIRVDGKTKHLGLFVSEKDAARAYNKAAIEGFGEFATLNDVGD
jgi:hypothetical protein